MDKNIINYYYCMAVIVLINIATYFTALLVGNFRSFMYLSDSAFNPLYLGSNLITVLNSFPFCGFCCAILWVITTLILIAIAWIASCDMLHYSDKYVCRRGFSILEAITCAIMFFALFNYLSLETYTSGMIVQNAMALLAIYVTGPIFIINIALYLWGLSKRPK